MLLCEEIILKTDPSWGKVDARENKQANKEFTEARTRDKGAVKVERLRY
jgi:hypothetical protein